MKFNDPNKRPVNGGGPVGDSPDAAVRRGVSDFHAKWGWMIAPGKNGQPKDISLAEAKAYEDHRKQLNVGNLQPHEVPPHISKIANVTRTPVESPTLNYKEMNKRPDETANTPTINYGKFNTPAQKVPESEAPTINYKEINKRPDMTNAPVIDYSKFKKSENTNGQWTLNKTSRMPKPNASGHEFHVLANVPGKEHEQGGARWHKVSHIEGDNYHIHGHSSPVSGSKNVIAGDWMHSDAAKSKNIGLSNQQAEGMKFNPNDTARNSKDFAKADANGQWSLNKEISKAESEMAFSNITELLHHIKELKSTLKPGEKLPEWVEAKLTLATDYLSSIAHYVDGAREAGRPLNKAK
jgi:hypothetical protein